MSLSENLVGEYALFFGKGGQENRSRILYVSRKERKKLV